MSAVANVVAKPLDGADTRGQLSNIDPVHDRRWTVLDDMSTPTDLKVLAAGGRCKRGAGLRSGDGPLNCDVLPLNIKDASRFLRKWPAATLDIEPPEALWPEAKGQAGSLARVRGHPLAPGRQPPRELSPPGGSPPPDPAIYGLAAPSVLPPCCLRGTRQDLPCTSAGEPRTPLSSCH